MDCRINRRVECPHQDAANRWHRIDKRVNTLPDKSYTNFQMEVGSYIATLKKGDKLLFKALEIDEVQQTTCNACKNSGGLLDYAEGMLNEGKPKFPSVK